jgi:integrase
MIKKDLELFKEYCQLQGLAPSTIREYSYVLAKVPRRKRKQQQYLKEYRQDRMLMNAWRKYIRSLRHYDKIEEVDYYRQLDLFYPPKRRGYIDSKKAGKAYPKSQWRDIIKNAPNRVAKIAIWCGFQFGLRLAELTHLRVEDIDFEKQVIFIRGHRQNVENGVKYWTPKHNHDRMLPFTSSQGRILKRWLKERSKDLFHPYILWTGRNGNPVGHRTFQRWCKQAHPELKAHDLRRSFATNLYYSSGKDVKIVQLALGHSNVATTSQYLRLDAKESMDRIREAMS